MYQAHQLEPVNRLFILAGLLVVAFMACGLALSFYRNALFQQTLEGMQQRNDSLEASIEQGFRDLQYYQSTQYKDKYAKENLGLQNEGEKVLILTDEQTSLQFTKTFEQIDSSQNNAAFYELVSQMPVIEHWRLYLFYPERIQSLKGSL